MIWPLGGPPAPELRPIGPDDLADCARWHAETFARPWTDGEFHDLLAGPGVGGMVARPAASRNGNGGGFVLTRHVLDEAEILTVAVCPACQGLGYGRALMEAALRRLHETGVASVFLEVDRANGPALALYRSLGFMQVGVRPDYYRAADGAKSEALVMRLDMPRHRNGKNSRNGVAA